MKKNFGKYLASKTLCSLSKYKNLSYELGVLQPEIVKNIVVISIGNIAVGGRGKSTITRFLSEYFALEGVKTSLLLRGYKGALEFSGGVVSNGDGPIVPVEEAGDEAYEAAYFGRGYSVTVGHNKVEQVKKAASCGTDLVIVDDGFQHQRLGRQLDIVSVIPDDYLTDPSCIMREERGSLKRADFTIGDEELWTNELSSKRTPPVLFKKIPNRFFNRELVETSIEDFAKQGVHLICAIGNVDSFIGSVESIGLNILSKSFYRDHHQYSEKDMSDAVKMCKKSGATALVTTTKDFFKLKKLQSEIPLYCLQNRVEIVKGRELLFESIKKLLIK